MNVSEAELLARVLLQSGDPFIFMDSESCIRIWNRGAELVFGWKAEEVIGRRIDFLLPEKSDFSARAEDFGESRDKAVVVQNYETILRAKDGREIPVTITITVIRGGKEEILGSSVTVRDVTREKRLESEVRWRTGEMELLDAVVHAVQESLDLDRILSVILTAITAGSGLGFNRAILFLIAGGSLEARLGVGASTWEEAARIWPRVANLPTLQAVIDFVLHDKEHEQTQLEHIIADWRVPLSDTESILVQCVRDLRSRVWPLAGAPDGVPARLNSPMFAVVPLVHSGEAIGVALADNAVTHRPIDEHAVRLLRLLANEASSAIANARLYQQLLEHAHNLEEAYEQIRNQQNLIIQGQHMSALGEIAEAISHEVKGPLVPIGGFARAMRRDVPEASTHASMLDIIIRETERLERVVKGVIALARPPAPHLKPISLSRTAEDVFGLYRAEAGGRGVHFVADIPPDLPPPHLDDDQWHQLFLNLVANALAATPDGGIITIRARLTENGWYRISVSDTGVGVKPEDVPRVFSPFYTAKPTGSSMGLNIVAKIIQLHQGRVSVESSVGKGTSIHIDVPPPEEMRARVERERQTTEEGRDESFHLDPLTVAALRRTGALADAPGRKPEDATEKR